MSARKPGSGRKQNAERIRELVSLLGSLSRTGDHISLDTLAGRLGVSIDEASAMMDIVCQASGEEASGLLISANDDFTEFTLQYPGVHGMPLRLTQSETIALTHALDLADIPDSEPIRTRVRMAFSSPEVIDQEVRKSLGFNSNPTMTPVIKLCALARATGHMIDFLYQGIADNHARVRCALIRNLRLENNQWYADAYDLDSLADRVFRLDRMSDVSLGPAGRLPEPHASSAEARRVEVIFHDPTYLTLFEWPGLRITNREDQRVLGTIPYYGLASDWLPRRIASCGGSLVVCDERIMQEARIYARNTLAELV